MNTDHTPPLFTLPDDVPHEQILVSADAPSGLRCIVAIHSTARGPGFGGCRMWDYASDQAALADALRLSQGMSLKNALANLPFGGAKAVIFKPAAPFDRDRLFSAFGDAVNAAAGRYITAEDVGSTVQDMRVVMQKTAFVSGIARAAGFGGDPSPMTALGVFVAIREGLSLHLRRPLRGATIAVQGLGAVGMNLCERLHDAGARLVVADLNEEREAAARSRFDARIAGLGDILTEPCDVLAPCALGAVLNGDVVPALRAAIVCGAANNQLAGPADGDALQARGILYLPDYLVNAGGIVSVAREYLRQGNAQSVIAEVEEIGPRVRELMERAGKHAPGRVADAWAREKMHERVRA